MIICPNHIGNPIAFVCIAPHNCMCQRKICAECQYEHEVDLKQTVPIRIFQKLAIQKLKDSKLDETIKLTQQRTDFKFLVSQTESMLKTIWEELSKSIKQIHDWIEQEQQSLVNLINEDINLAETSATDLEKIKNFYLKELDKIKSRWNHHSKAFIEKQKEGIQQIQSIIQIQSNEEEEESKVYQMKEDLYEMLICVQDINDSLYKKILEILRRDNVSDILEFISSTNNQHFYESLINKHDNISNIRKKIKKIMNVLRNIQDHKFNKDDYSSVTYKNEKQDLIKRIVDKKGIIDFLKFIVKITCGSNGLSLLVAMKVDLRNQSFENIRIKDASLIGGNFVRCNLSGSKFDNIDISGLNLSGAKMFNCKWKNIKIHEVNKLDGHSSSVRSACISPDGNTLASGSNDKSIRLWDVKTGQQQAKLDGHENWVASVCFSPDGNTLASGSYDNSIRLWDVKTLKEIDLINTLYKDIFTQFQIPLMNSSLLPNIDPDRTILRICQNPLLEASGTLILKGEFISHQGKDLKPLFKSKGSCFLEDLKQKQFINNNYNQYPIFLLIISLSDSTHHLHCLRQVSKYFPYIYSIQFNVHLLYLNTIHIYMVSLAQGIFMGIQQKLFSGNIQRNQNFNNTTLNQQSKQRIVSTMKRLKQRVIQLLKENQFNTIFLYKSFKILYDRFTEFISANKQDQSQKLLLIILQKQFFKIDTINNKDQKKRYLKNQKIKPILEVFQSITKLNQLHWMIVSIILLYS
ncbi:unnamed protein product [Paramecium pentaurelia]|uniref:Uncharacterized protein n=1 Tax=Paramecium pentaurelia TaxID=43138 RepID=A0A8S1USN8_9CILI|nr:unnamed protein product [Paramecium pentaurelia]